MKRFKIALLSLLAFSLAACGSKEQEAGTGAGGEKAMGRYMETEFMLPEEDGVSAVRRLNDGRLMVIKQYEGIYYSSDEGQTWEKAEDSWYQEISQNAYLNERRMAIAPDGGIFLAYEVDEEAPEEMGEEPLADIPEDEPEADEAAGEDSGISYMDLEFHFIHLYVDAAGEQHEFDNPLPPESLLSDVLFLEDGRLLGLDEAGNIYEINLETGEFTQLFSVGGGTVQLAEGPGSVFVICEEDFFLYDSETWQQEEDEVLRQFVNENYNSRWLVGGDEMLFAQDEQRLYVACPKGLFSHEMGGSVMEQLIDGKLNTLGDPTYLLMGLMPLENEEFLVAYSDSLMRYVYDPDISTVPETELKIYSLEENPLLRKAAASYAKDKPDVYVNYEYGMTGEDGKTSEDAIKALHTELMAGKGPDVMALDGLPVDSYMEKGILLDMKETVESAYGGNLLENIAYTYETPEGLYAIPAQFRVPIIAGDTEDVHSISDISSMADAMEKLREKEAGGLLTGNYQEKQMLTSLLTCFRPDWMNEDGTLDEETLADYLNQARRIYAAEMSGVSEAEIQEAEEFSTAYTDDTYYMQIGDGVIRWFEGQRKVAFGYVEGISLDMDSVSSVIRESGNAEMKGLDGVFLPNTILGVSAGSSKVEMALDFVNFALSEEMNSGWGGFPANQTSYESIWTNTYGTEAYGNMSVLNDEGVLKMLPIYWPDAEEQAAFQAIVDTLDTPNVTDNFIMDTIVEFGADALSGKKTVEQAVGDIMKKMQIYLSE